MSGVWPDRVSNDRKRLIGELLRGRDSTLQLQALLSNASGDEKAVLADDILRSFSESISVMSSGESAEVSDDVVFGDSGESKRRPVSKQARGCYKRRRGLQSSTTIASTVEDGHAWRKYGQKEILNSKFPRCYFRCTHKHDQGCKAIRQVQKMEDNPDMYRITYFGQHSCREIMSAPQMIPDSDPRESNVPGTCCESKYQICDPDNQPNNPFPCVKDDSASDLPGFGSSAEPTTDFSLGSFSNYDGFRDFPDMDFMSRYINFDG